MFGIILFIALALLLSNPICFALSTQGFTVTSVSLSNILHPGQSASETQWLVTMSLNGGGQSLVGVLDNSTINYQGITSVYPLQISGSTDPEEAFFVINNDPIQINKFTILSVQKGSITSYLNLYLSVTEAPLCPSGYFGEWDAIVPSGWVNGASQKVVDRICIGLQTIGSKSSIPSVPNIQFSSHFNFVANGQNENLDLSFDKTSATSSTGLVQANWVGSLVSGNAPPDGNQYVAINNPQTSSWIVKQSSDFINWDNLFTSQENQYKGTHTFSNSNPPGNCNGILPSGVSTAGIVDWNALYTSFTNCLTSQIQNDISPTNAKADALMSSGITIGNNPTTVVSYNGQNAFKIPLASYFVTNPVVTLRFSGSYIGVVIPMGTPKIMSASSDCFNSGDTGSIKVQVKNIGTAQGTFYVSLSNCPGLNTESSTNYAVQSGQSQEINVPIHTTGSNQQLNQQCSVTITDYNGGGSDTSQVNICMKQANQCTPNSQLVEGNSICPCVNVNGVWQPATGNQCKTCDYGVISDGKGGWTCASNPNSVSNSNPASQPTQNNPGMTGQFVLPFNPIIAVIIGMAAVVGIGSYFIWKKGIISLETMSEPNSKPTKIKTMDKKIKESDYKFCTECGSKQKANVKFCTNCGKKSK
jgi:hypothetical protein